MSAAESKKMTCVIVNRNYPPSSGITGYSANKLAGVLEANGVKVTIVTVGGGYAGGVSSQDAQIHGEICSVAKVYDGKNKVARLFGSLLEGWRLAKKAIALRPSIIIGMTDPPLLNYWISKFSSRAQIPWIYWSMDIYPEAFVASSLVSENNPLFKWLKKSIASHPPAHLLSLGPNQCDYIKKTHTESISSSLMPCGIAQITRSQKPPAWHPGLEKKIVLGYVGNIGEAHDPDFVIDVIKALDPNLHVFILTVYGVHAERVISSVAHLPYVKVFNQIDRSELGWIDIHLTTLRQHWDHICVPSKAVSAVCAGGTLLSCCSEQTDNWQLLSRAGWRINPNENYSAQISSWLESLNREALNSKKAASSIVANELLEMEKRAEMEVLKVIEDNEV